MTKLRLRLWLVLRRLDPKRYRVAIDRGKGGRPRHAILVRHEADGTVVILDSWHDPADELPQTYCTRRGCPARKTSR